MTLVRSASVRSTTICCDTRIDSASVEKRAGVALTANIFVNRVGNGTDVYGAAVSGRAILAIQRRARIGDPAHIAPNARIGCLALIHAAKISFASVDVACVTIAIIYTMACVFVASVIAGATSRLSVLASTKSQAAGY